MAQHTELGKKIIESLEQAIAYERGEYEPPRAHRVAVTARQTTVAKPPRYDSGRVRAIRRRLALSQRVFAEALNVSPGTVRAWEQGSRVPDGPTRRLLEIAEEAPELFTRKVQPSRKEQQAGLAPVTP
jgi:putative transcriptional regulator